MNEHDESGLVAGDLRVRYGSQVALDAVSLTVAPGQIVAVVGPSGCGKTTLLRTIAGLELPESGTLTWNGEDLRRTPAHARGFGLMFQDHALFPHRTVSENVAFGLRMQRLGRADRRRRTEEMLTLVGLEGFGQRRVDTLSGGEAQRVALARALAPAPRLLMLDEPFGSLDRALRERLADELAGLLRSLGQAAIHVTHDQDEAFAIADRLVVMRDGRVRREGPSAQVWLDPRDRWVASFLGHPNVLDPGDARRLGLGDATQAVLVPETAISLVPAGANSAADQQRRHGDTPGEVAGGKLAAGAVAARVEEVRARAGATRVQLRTLTYGIGLIVHRHQPPAEGSRCWVTIDPDAVVPLACGHE